MINIDDQELVSVDSDHTEITDEQDNIDKSEDFLEKNTEITDKGIIDNETNSSQSISKINQKKIEELSNKNTELEKNISELTEKNLKLLAEIDNNFKKFRRDLESQRKYEVQSLAKKILPIIDNFEAATNIKVNDKGINQFLIGFKMMLKNLKETLKSEGINEIEAEIGKEFNPYFHHAVDYEHTNNDEEDNKISSVLIKGYKLHDRILRPASVKILKVKEDSDGNTKDVDNVKKDEKLQTDEKIDLEQILPN